MANHGVNVKRVTAGIYTEKIQPQRLLREYCKRKKYIAYVAHKINFY